MSLILCLETTTGVCSVALCHRGEIVGIRETSEKNAHSRVLHVFIDEILNQSNYTYSSLDAVAVSKGPGSYTGLRIGVSAAKGLCYALDIPLIAIDTLKSMAWGFRHRNHELPADSLLCPMIDARRMEVFTAMYDLNLNTIHPISASIITSGSFTDELARHPVFFFGDGAAKCADVLGHRQNARIVHDFNCSAAFLAHLAQEKYMAQAFENLAYFEPFYLKDFIAGIPNVKGLSV